MDYYKILGIKNTSTDKEIKNAYRMLAKKFHPDTYKGNKDIAESKMKELNEAYDVLSDEKKKKEYDEKINPHKSIYEENSGSNYAAYSNTEEYAGNRDWTHPNQSNSRQNSGYYYNYAPFEEEKNYGHPDYKTYDFSEITRNIKNKFKHLLFSLIGIIVLTVICISLIFRLLWNAVNGVIQYGNNAYVSMQEDKKNKSDETTSSELTKEDIEKAIDTAEQKAQEWYDTEGKEYKEEWNKMMEELKLQVQEEMKSKNVDN